MLQYLQQGYMQNYSCITVPDGLVYDASFQDTHGLPEIKCPTQASEMAMEELYTYYQATLFSTQNRWEIQGQGKTQLLLSSAEVTN